MIPCKRSWSTIIASRAWDEGNARLKNDSRVSLTVISTTLNEKLVVVVGYTSRYRVISTNRLRDGMS